MVEAAGEFLAGRVESSSRLMCIKVLTCEKATLTAKNTGNLTTNLVLIDHAS